MYIYICIYTCRHTHIYIYIQYTHTHIYIYTYVYIYIHSTHTHIYIYTHAYVKLKVLYNPAQRQEILEYVFGKLFPGLSREAWPNSANLNLYRDGRQGVGGAAFLLGSDIWESPRCWDVCVYIYGIIYVLICLYSWIILDNLR